MEEITNTSRTDAEYNFDEPKASPSFGRGNFKTFTLLRQQENLITQFESNLQKTLELLNNKSPTSTNPEFSTQEDKTRSITFENSEIMKSSRVEPQQNFFDKENYALKMEIRDLKRENEMLKVNLNSMTANKNTEDRQRTEPLQRELDELKKRLNESVAENDTLRTEIIKVKTDSFKKYEQLQKNNDELLISYEERFKITMKNTNDRHEAEVRDLQTELAQAQEEIKRSDQNQRQLKEKLGGTILQLERDKQDLLNKISQYNVMNENSSADSFANNGTSILLDQVLKEKQECQKRYDELFASYTTLLEHNKILNKRLEITERTEREELSTHHRKASGSRERSFLNENSIQSSHYMSGQHFTSHGNIPADPSVGRIRRNQKEKGQSNLSFTSNDDEKFLKSQLKQSDIFDPSRNSSVLKPKQHIMNMDELKHELSQYDNDDFNPKLSGYHSSKNVSPRQPSPRVKFSRKNSASIQSPPSKDLRESKELKGSKSSASKINSNKKTLSSQKTTSKAVVDKENIRNHKENKENARPKTSQPLEEKNKEMLLQSESKKIPKMLSSARKNSQDGIDSSKRQRDNSFSKLNSEQSSQRELLSSSSRSKSNMKSNESNVKPSSSKDPLKPQVASPTHFQNIEIAKKTAAGTPSNSSRPGSSKGAKIPVYSKISKK